MLGMPALDGSEVDRLLAIALTLHDRDICPGGCGMYLDETLDVDGWHSYHKVVCDGCAARDSDEEDRQPGQLGYVTDDRKD